MEDALDRVFPDIPDFDEYVAQDVIETSDGEFFDGLDEAFGIVPRTDELLDKEQA